jgi:hypothetical protein
MGDYRLCVQDAVSAAWIFIAQVRAELQVANCQFDVNGPESPCGTPVCKSDPTGEMCLQYTLEYCAESPFDTGCAFVVPTFERRVGEVTDVSIHIATDTPVALRVLPASCTCGETCRAGVAVVDTKFASSNALGVVTASLVGDLPGDYILCSGPFGSMEPAKFTTLVASVAMLPTGCLFQGSDSPCVAKQCVDAETSEACQLLVAEYCAAHPEDGGCAQLFPILHEPRALLELWNSTLVEFIRSRICRLRQPLARAVPQLVALTPLSSCTSSRWMQRPRL